MVIRRNVRGDGRSALMTGRSRHHIAHRADTVAVGFLRPDGLAAVTGRSLDQSGARSPQRAGRLFVHG